MAINNINNNDSGNAVRIILNAVINAVNALTTTYVKLTGGNLSGAVNANKGTSLPSASTVNIGAATGEFVHITGTTTITAFDTIQAGAERTVVFDGNLTLTHSANLILPSGSDITAAVNDSMIVRSEGSGVWRVVSYTKASGLPVTSPSTFGIWGIASLTGEFTFYADLSSAVSAITSGQVLNQFANVTEASEVTIELPDGITLQGNGYSYTYTHNSQPFNDNNNAPNLWIYNWTLNVTTYTGFAFDSRGKTVSDGSFKINSTAGGGYYSETSGTVIGARGDAFTSGIYLTGTSVAYEVYGKSNKTTYDASSCGIKAESGTSVYNSVGETLGHWSLGNTTSNAGTFYNCIGIGGSQGCREGTHYGTKSYSPSGYSFHSCDLMDGCIGVGKINGVAKVINSTINGTAVSTTFGTADNCTEIIDSTITCTGVGSAITRTDNIANVTVINEYNNANGHAVIVDNTSVIRGLRFKLANTGANVINSTTAQNVDYSDVQIMGGSAVPTTAINLNVTQTSTITDMYGNILT